MILRLSCVDTIKDTSLSFPEQSGVMEGNQHEEKEDDADELLIRLLFMRLNSLRQRVNNWKECSGFLESAVGSWSSFQARPI